MKLAVCSPSNRRRLGNLVMAAVVSVAGSLAMAERAAACPFCTAQAQTLTETVKGADAVLLAQLTENPRPPAAPTADKETDLEAEKLTFATVKCIKGGEKVAALKSVRVLYFGSAPKGTMFLLFGYDEKKLGWTTPLALSDRSLKYVDDVLKLPESGNDRLTFFQKHLEDKEELIGRDAYDEFAKTSYADLKKFKDHIDRKRVLERIAAPDITASYRRMYLSLLSICGKAEDVPLLEKMIRSEEKADRVGLDALVNCYLALRGEGGLPLIEKLFLDNPKSDYTDTYAALMAIRFQGDDGKAIPRERLLVSLRLLLNNPKWADLVIPDLARWQDWTVLPRLVTLFKDATEENSWVRVPVICYLQECPKPEAKQALAELEKIDPTAVKQARSLFPFLGAKKVDPKTEGKDGKDAEKADAADKKEPAGAAK